MHQLPLNLVREIDYSAHSFLVTPSNKAAKTWVDQWPEWPSHAIIILGDAGAGKSHLAHIWSTKSQGQLVSSSQLTDAFLEQYQQSPQHLAIEIASPLSHEEPLLHLYNISREHHKNVLFLFQTLPEAASFKIADLKSRLLSLPSATILSPDDALLEGILRKCFSDLQLRVPQDVVLYLLRHMERSHKAAQNIIQELDALSLTHQRQITISLAKQALDMINPSLD